MNNEQYVRNMPCYTRNFTSQHLDSMMLHRRPRFLCRFLLMIFLIPYPTPEPAAPKAAPRVARIPFFTAHFPKALARPRTTPFPAGARADIACRGAPPACLRRLFTMFFSVPHTGRIARHGGSNCPFLWVVVIVFVVVMPAMRRPAAVCCCCCKISSNYCCISA